MVWLLFQAIVWPEADQFGSGHFATSKSELLCSRLATGMLMAVWARISLPRTQAVVRILKLE